MAPTVDAGLATCARCQQPILPGKKWHLDHDDENRRRYIGVSHASCNGQAGGRVGRAKQTAAAVNLEEYEDDPGRGIFGGRRGWMGCRGGGVACWNWRRESA